MHILLINTNPVVSRLISLCIRDDDMLLEEVKHISEVKRDRYEMVFVDDASYVDDVKLFVDSMMVKKRVYFSVINYFDEAFEGFDEVIKKPFLPSQITATIESLKVLDESMQEIELEEEGSNSFIFPLSTETVDEEETLEDNTKTELSLISDNENIDESETIDMLINSYEDVMEDESEDVKEIKETVLNSSEIERIKALLEEDEEADEVLLELNDDDYESRKVEVITEHLEADGLEIISEDDIVNILSKKEKVEKKKVKKKKKSNKKKEKVYTFEEALIAAVEGMKPKKIKKLLKDAEITISINFKDKK